MKKHLLSIIIVVMLIFTASITVNAATVKGSVNTGWSYDESTSTLTLTNYTSTEVISVGSETCQIYSDGDLNIVLEGTNTLNLTSIYGIYVEGNLTISGTGTLNISNATNGIFASKNITIKSGTISASSMQARGGGITIDDGKLNLSGNITASDGQVTINKGEINANRISAKDIVIVNGTVIANIHGTNLVEIKGGDITSNNGMYVEIYKTLKISGGKVTINGTLDANCWIYFSGGEITITDGIYGSQGNLSVTGGNINIVGGIDKALDMSNGTMCVEGNIGGVMDSRVSGGTLTIKGQLYSGWSSVYISGGTVTIESDSYGLYAPDEDIIISGGELFITGKTQALKAGGELKISGAFETGDSSKRASYAESYYSEKYIHISFSGNIDTTPKIFPAIITINGQTIEDNYQGIGWKYDAESSTLTLNNGSITSTGEINGTTYQIYSDGDLNIVLEETNNLNLSSTYGIYVEGNLTISGTGTLNISNATNGIFASKNITIKSGTISASSIQARGGGITVDNGQINLTGNIIANDGQVTINNGEINANRISAKDIVIVNGTITANIHGTNLVEIKGGDITSNNGMYVEIYKTLKISGGKVTINGTLDANCWIYFSGGEITITDGIYGSQGNLSVTGGNINIVGGIDKALDMSNGTMCVEGNIGGVMDSRVSGGTLTIKGQLYSGWSSVYISGGTVTIESDSYGLYAPDEDIIISGGTVSIFGQTQALKAGGEIRWSGNCISLFTGSTASNAKVETEYYGEKYVSTKESHSWNSGSVTANPTHVTEGTRTYTCNKCSNTKYEAIPKTTAHEFGGWIYLDEVNHKRVCPCGEIETASHTWSDATCTTKSKCDICNSERGDLNIDNHTAATSWTSADGQHYHMCTNGCDAKLDIADCSDSDKDHKCDVCSADMGTHEAASGKHTCDYCSQIVTECVDSDKDHKCDVCSNTMGTDATEKEPGNESGVNSDANTNEEAGYMGIIIASALGVVGIASFAGIMFAKKKK